MTIKIGNIEVGPNRPFLIIAGPCVIESWDVLFNTAAALRDIANELGFSLVFKSSYDKANRTSINSFRRSGIGQRFGYAA